MDRPSKFDRAIQDKLAGLEGEPSARVWAGIRAEIGVAPRRNTAIWLRAAAAVTLLLLCGPGVYYLTRSEAPTESLNAHAFSQPQQRNWPEYKYKQNPSSDSATAPILPRQRTQLPPQHGRDQMIANHPQPQKQDKAPQIIQHKAPLQDDLRQLVRQDVPKTPLETPVQDQPLELIADNSAPASAANKRSYRLPTAEDLTIANLREKSKGILPTLAENADSKLGIPTDYKRQSTDEGELTAFSMDLGFVKFRKVRKTK